MLNNLTLVTYFIIKTTLLIYFFINIRENRRTNHEWTIQRQRQHCAQDTERKQKDKKTKPTHKTKS